MQDDDLAIEDRFAGLLVLLYAQHITVVSKLPTTAVIIEGTETSLLLGTTPLLLPDPLDKLARKLLARRRGHTTIGSSSDSTWLFPGAYAGQRLSHHHLGVRLKRLGIYSRPGRTSALMGLSTQLPHGGPHETSGPQPGDRHRMDPVRRQLGSIRRRTPGPAPPPSFTEPHSGRY